MENITLDQLRGGSADEIQTTADTTQEQVNTVKEVKIEDIKPFAPKANPQEQAASMLFGELDAAINRNKEELSKTIQDGKEKIIQAKLDSEEPENKKVEVTTPVVVPTVAEEKEDDLDVFDKDYEYEPKQQPTTTNRVVKAPTLPDDDVNPFAMTNDDDFDSDLGDDDIDEEAEQKKEEAAREKQFEELRVEVEANIKPVQNKIDLSKFTISKKPITVSKLLAIGDTSKHIADWILYGAGKSVSFSELSGQEIEKLNVAQSGRNRINSYKTVYSVMYNHLVDTNKPESLEAWIKSILFFDIDHMNFALYKACFENSNFIPYKCPHCNKVFMQKIDIGDMVKYKDDEVKARVEKILQKDTTSESTYETQLVPISDKYVVGLRMPSVYNVIFENSILDEDFTRKYNDILGIIAYIEDIYYIDEKDMQLVPVSTNPDPSNMGKTVRRKVRAYYEIFKSLNSDQYAQFLMEVKKINEINTNDVSYIIPAIKCTNPECGKEIPEIKQDPLGMLFTRHQLIVLANSSKK